MVLLIAGVLLLALGLFAGGVLIAAPLGVAALSPNITLWILFPLLISIGYVLIVMGGRVTHISKLSFIASCLLVLLALIAATSLVLSAASILPITNTSSLWYVLVVAGCFGGCGVGSHSLDSDKNS
ncbi:MAG: hypothetical protein NVS3B3_14150 [Aquirhabdus sp.]